MEVSPQTIYQSVLRDRESRRLRFGFSWARFGWWIGSVAIFTIISFIAITVSLGYRVDFSAGVIQQTGLVEFDGPLRGVAMHIYLNNNEVASELPATINDVMPGQYTVSVKLDGYKTWSQNIDVNVNDRVVLDDVYLTYTKITPEPDTSVSMNDSRFTSGDTDDLQIRNQDELWINGDFFTRTSQNLYYAQWLPHTNLVTVQAGNQILLIDPSPIAGTQIQVFAPLPTNKITPYFFNNSGQELEYRTSTGVMKEDLYQQLGLFNFLY